MWANVVGVDRACIELHLLGQRIRNDAEKVLVVIGRAFPIMIVTIQLDELIRLPFLEDERTASDRMSIKRGCPAWRIFQASSRIGRPPSSGPHHSEDAPGRIPICPCSERRRIKTFVNDPDRERINDFHLFHGFIIGNARGEVLGVHDGLIGELHILGFEGMAIMKFHTGPQVKDDDRIVFRRRQHLACIHGLLLRVHFRIELNIFLCVECLEIILSQNLGKAFKQELVHLLQNKLDSGGAPHPDFNFSFLGALFVAFSCRVTTYSLAGTIESSRILSNEDLT